MFSVLLDGDLAKNTAVLFKSIRQEKSGREEKALQVNGSLARWAAAAVVVVVLETVPAPRPLAAAVVVLVVLEAVSAPRPAQCCRSHSCCTSCPTRGRERCSGTDSHYTGSASTHTPTQSYSCAKNDYYI